MRTLSCEMVIWGFCWVNAWMTMSPRAREVMKLGSPVKASSVEAGVGFGEGTTGAAVGGMEGGTAEARGWRGVRLKRGPFPSRLWRISGGDSRTISTINAQTGLSQDGGCSCDEGVSYEKISKPVLNQGHRRSKDLQKEKEAYDGNETRPS